MRRASLAVAASALIACGSGSGGSTRGSGSTALQVRWVAHLHEPRTTKIVAGIGLDQDGDASILYYDSGVPGGIPALHLQRRGQDGSIEWDQPWGWSGPTPSGFAVTPVGSVIVSAAGAGVLDLGSTSVTLTPQQPASIANIDPWGRVAWHVERSEAAAPLAVGADGGLVVGSTAAAWGGSAAVSAVTKYRRDGAIEWTAPVFPPRSAAIAPDGGSGAYLAANDPGGDPAAGATLVHLVDAAPVWTGVFEHAAVEAIAAAPDGGVVGWAWGWETPRYDGAPLPYGFRAAPGNAGAFAFAIAADGALRWATDRLWTDPGERPLYGGWLGVSSRGEAVFATERWVKLSDTSWMTVTDVGALDASGQVSWRVTVDDGQAIRAAAYDGRDLLLVVVAAGAVTIAGTRVEPFDGESPVLVMLSPP